MTPLTRSSRGWVAVLVLAAGCGGDTPDPVKPVAGDLIVSYVGGTAPDGALLLVVCRMSGRWRAIGSRSRPRPTGRPSRSTIRSSTN